MTNRRYVNSKLPTPFFWFPWLDEEQLVWSDSLTTTLEKTIKSEIDFLIVLLPTIPQFGMGQA